MTTRGGRFWFDVSREGPPVSRPERAFAPGFARRMVRPAAAPTIRPLLGIALPSWTESGPVQELFGRARIERPQISSRNQENGAFYPYWSSWDNFASKGGGMSTAVCRILCIPTFNAVQPLSMTVAASRLALCVAAVFLAASGGAAAATAEDLEACYKAQRDAAISACTAAITSKKHQGAELATAHVVRGNAYFSKGDYDAAIRDYDEAIRLNPKNAVAFYNRGNVYNSAAQYDAAISNFDEAIRIRPDYANAFNNRCSAYNAKGEYDLAIRDCSQALQLDPKKANAFVGLGNAYNRKHDYDAAMKAYDEAIQLDADSVSAYLGRCSVYIGKANYSSAIENCDKAIKLQP